MATDDRGYSFVIGMRPFDIRSFDFTPTITVTPAWSVFSRVAAISNQSD
jgi:hypothetical protein